MKTRKYQFLSGSALKIIAAAVMLADHIGAVLLKPYLDGSMLSPGRYETLRAVYVGLRNFGRSAFPVFCFLLVEGFLHTHDRKKYTGRLFVFCIVSEIPFDLALYGRPDLRSQNVFFTLLLGFLVIWAMQAVEKRRGRDVVSVTAQAALFAAGAAAAQLLHTDYGANGVLLITIFYMCRYSRGMAGIAGYLAFLWEKWCFPAFILIQFYNGKRGMRLKYAFYLFYPAHLLLLACLRLFVLS